MLCSRCGNEGEAYKGYKVCKECTKEERTAYRRTLEGYAMQLWFSRKAAVRHDVGRAQTLEFTKEEFLKWLYEQEGPSYAELFETFKESGFDTHKAPSVDRLDASKGYSLDNIQLMVRYDNMRKGFYDTSALPLRSNTSGKTGVVKIRGKWEARMTLDGKRVFLGHYKTFEEAVAAREDAEQRRKEGKPMPSFSRNTSGKTGVVKRPDGWRATITHNKKTFFLGLYKTFEEAKAAREEAERKLAHGEELANVRPSNKSGTVGVTFVQTKGSWFWRAYIAVNKKQYFLGQFKDKELAIAARRKAEERISKGLPPK